MPTCLFEVESGAASLAAILDAGPYDYVVNCIGILNADIDEASPTSVARAVRVNALFPHELAAVTAARGTRVLHVSTDAVFSGFAGAPRFEDAPIDPVDVYGRSKALGESACPHVLNIRCSIVGRHPAGRGLTEWYLRTDPAGVATGYVDYIWTPVTVYQLADFIHAVVVREFQHIRRAGPLVHFAPNPPLSKFDYLTQVRALSGRGARVEPALSPGGPCSRALATSRPIAGDWPIGDDWDAALRQLVSAGNEVQ
jgi:dTDP-4-dehydrorhamnose reductase